MQHGFTTSLYRLVRFLLLCSVLGSTAAAYPSAQARSTSTLSAVVGANEVNKVYLPLTTNFPTEAPRFGVQIDEATSQVSTTALNGISDVGAGWLRFGAISWRNLQPNENDGVKWNSDIDSLIRTMAARGVSINAVVFDFPEWAKTKPNECSAIKPSKYAAFTAFMVQVINRYKTPEYNIHNWELGNEIDKDGGDSNSGCWGNISDTRFFGGQEYGKMLKAVVPTLRQQDSALKIWHAGLLLDNPNTTDPSKGKPELFLNGVLDAGGGPYFDVLPIHSYAYYGNERKDYDTDPSNPWSSLGGAVIGKVKYAKSTLDGYGQGDKPIFMNEVALLCYRTASYCKGTFDRLDDKFYAVQATFVVRSYTRALSKGVVGLTWFCLTGSWQHSFLLSGEEKTPTYNAYKQFIVQMRYGKFNRYPTYSGDVEAYSFSKGVGTETHVIWAIQDVPTQISVPQSTFVSATAMDGSELPKTLVGSNYQLTATFEPIYVTVHN